MQRQNNQAACRRLCSKTFSTALIAFVFALVAQFGAPKASATVSTTTSLTASTTNAPVGTSIALKAKVTPSSGSTPTGKVTFTVNGSSLGTANLSSGTASLTASTSGVAAGTYSVLATYGGSSSDATSKTTISITLTSGSGNPTGTALSSCADLTKSGSYYLSANVSSSGTCFFIDADKITLNLNGHTITYATGGGSLPTPAVLLADSWYTAPGYGLAKTGSTDNHGSFVMYGGTITEASGAANRSTCIWVGQSNDISPAPIVHNMTLNTNNTDSSPIFATVDVSGWQIYGNTINYNSTSTSSRYDFYGYAVWLGDQPGAAGVVPDQIYNNSITNAPQGGIFDDHQNAQIHNNTITFNSYYANDYCIIDYNATGQVIANNTCDPKSGRGIDVEAANVQVTGNTITVTELPQDAEYNGCEGGGADGIRVRDNAPDTGNGNNNITNPTGVTLSGNTVTANATQCQANALRLTSLQSNDIVTFSNNKFTSTGAGTSSIPDYAISYDGDNVPVLTFSGNTLSSKYSYVEVDWDGANVVMDVAQTWSGAPSYDIDNENGFLAGSGSSAPTFTQSINIDASTTGKIKCGTSAAGATKFGSTSQTCN